MTRHSMFQVLVPSLHWMKLSAVPWLMIRSRKQLESLCLFSLVNFFFRSFISLLFKLEWISTSNPS